MTATTTRAAAHARQDEALRLREQGYTVRQIVVALAFAGNGAVSQALTSAMTRRLSCGLMSRTFGIEIECVGLSRSQAVRALRDAGINAVDEGYTHAVTTHWKVVSDSSLVDASGQTCEVVSPIMRGQDGLAEVARVMDALRAAGATVNRSCGMHVHIGANDLDAAAVYRVVANYTKNQQAIDTVHPASRRSTNGGTLYEPYRAYEINSIESNVRSGADKAHLYSDRYKTVNLCSLRKYGTIEFRQHAGSLNGEKAAAWVQFVMAMVEAAVRIGDLDVEADITALTTKMTEASLMDATAATYLTRRAQTVTV